MASQHPVPLDASVARVVARLDPGRLEAFEETAATLEFDQRLAGGREAAEARALILVLARHGFPGAPSVHLLQAEIDGGTQWLLTDDAVSARRTLADLGATQVVRADLADTLDRQYAGLAALATFP